MKSVHVGENPMRTGLLFLRPCKSPQSLTPLLKLLTPLLKCPLKYNTCVYLFASCFII